VAEPEGTLRERMRRTLARESLTALELSHRLSATEREIEAAIPHVERSVKAAGGRLKVTPPECSACGYVFQERTRARKPSRCPQCRATRVRAPRFSVAQRD